MPFRRERRERVDFKVLKSFEKKYGSGKFVEISLKETEDGNKFISLSKGYYDRDGNKRYSKSFGFANEQEMKDFVIDSFKNL